jgi:hypothetical protein
VKEFKKEVTFAEGEKWCRYGGVLMSPENHKLEFGFIGEAGKYDDGTLWLYEEELGSLFIEKETLLECYKVFILNSSENYTSIHYENELHEAHGFGESKTFRRFDCERLHYLDDISVLTPGLKSKINFELYWDFYNQL